MCVRACVCVCVSALLLFHHSPPHSLASLRRFFLVVVVDSVAYPGSPVSPPIAIGLRACLCVCLCVNCVDPRCCCVLPPCLEASPPPRFSAHSFASCAPSSVFLFFSLPARRTASFPQKKPKTHKTRIVSVCLHPLSLCVCVCVWVCVTYVHPRRMGVRASATPATPTTALPPLPPQGTCVFVWSGAFPVRSRVRQPSSASPRSLTALLFRTFLRHSTAYSVEGARSTSSRVPLRRAVGVAHLSCLCVVSLRACVVVRRRPRQRRGVALAGTGGER